MAHFPWRTMILSSALSLLPTRFWNIFENAFGSNCLPIVSRVARNNSPNHICLLFFVYFIPIFVSRCAVSSTRPEIVSFQKMGGQQRKTLLHPAVCCRLPGSALSFRTFPKDKELQKRRVVKIRRDFTIRNSTPTPAGRLKNGAFSAEELYAACPTELL